MQNHCDGDSEALGVVPLYHPQPIFRDRGSLQYRPMHFFGDSSALSKSNSWHLANVAKRESVLVEF